MLSSSPERARQRVPGPVALFLWLSLVLNVTAIGIELFCRYIFHSLWPYESPLLNDPPYPDLHPFDERFLHIHTPAFFGPSPDIPFVYPAPVAPLYALILKFSHPAVVFWIAACCVALGAASWFAWSLRKSAGLTAGRALLIAFGTLALSFPFAFELKQANMEIFICVLVGAGIWLFLRDRMHLAAACFGIAMSMKIFPFIFAGLFLARRRFSPIVTMAVVGALVTVASLRYLDPSLAVAWHGIAQNLAWLQFHTILNYLPEMGFDHSLFALVKAARTLSHPSQETVLKWLHMYMLIAAILGTALYFLRIRRLPVLNQVLCLYVVSVLLPPSSFDYTLQHLYIPFAMLVFFAVRTSGQSIPGLKAAFVCLAILTSIETEVILPMGRVAHTTEGSIKALALLALLYVGARYPFGDHEESEAYSPVASSAVPAEALP